MNKQYRNESWTAGMLLGLYALLIVALLLLVFVGARLYRTTERTKRANSAQRNAVAYVQGKLAGYDEMGVVTLKNGTYGTVLVLREKGDRYETKIYLYEGKLVEELSAAGSEIDPSRAVSVCAVNAFEVEQASPTLLQVRVDGQLCYVCIRNEGGVDT